MSWLQIATFVGSGQAGVLISHFNPGIALAIDSFSFIISAVTLATMHEKRISVAAKHKSAAEQFVTSPSNGDEQLVDSAVSPVTFRQMLGRSRFLQFTLVMITCWNLGGGGTFDVALPVFTHNILKAAASGYGTILAAFAIGALLGALMAGMLGKLPHRGMISLFISIVMACFMTLVPFLGSVLAVSCALAMAGLLNGLGNVIFTTRLQQVFPRHLMGRFMGALAFTNFGFYPLSVAVGGVLVAHYGPTLIFLLNGAFIAVPCIFGLIQRRFREL